MSSQSTFVFKRLAETTRLGSNVGRDIQETLSTTAKISFICVCTNSSVGRIAIVKSWVITFWNKRNANTTRTTEWIRTLVTESRRTETSEIVISLLDATSIFVAIIMASTASFVLLNLLTVTTGISELIKVSESGLTDTLVRFSSIHTNGVSVTVIESRSSTFVDESLTDNTRSVLRVWREVNESSFASTDVTFGSISTNSIWRTVMGSKLTFILFGNTKTTRLVNRVWRLIKESIAADTEETIIGIDTVS